MNLKRNSEDGSNRPVQEEERPSLYVTETCQQRNHDPQKSKSFVKANKQVTDEDILKIIATEVKKLKDSVEQISQAHTEDEARQGAIQEHINSTNKEIAVLSAYLPQELSKEEIQSVVDEVIARI